MEKSLLERLEDMYLEDHHEDDVLTQCTTELKSTIAEIEKLRDEAKEKRLELYRRSKGGNYNSVRADQARILKRKEGGKVEAYNNVLNLLRKATK